MKITTNYTKLNFGNTQQQAKKASNSSIFDNERQKAIFAFGDIEESRQAIDDLNWVERRTKNMSKESSVNLIKRAFKSLIKN